MIKSVGEACGSFVIEAHSTEIKHQFGVLDDLPRLLLGHRSRRCLLNYRSTVSITVVSTVVSLSRSAVRFFPVFDESVGF
jgi:hypothetical protein